MSPRILPIGVGISISPSVPRLILLLRTAQPPVIDRRNKLPFCSWLSTRKSAGSGLRKDVLGERIEE